MMMSHHGKILINPVRGALVNRYQHIKNDLVRSVDAKAAPATGSKILGFKRITAKMGTLLTVVKQAVSR
jgi:hypothetical protein